MFLCIITVRNSSCGKVMFSQACVKNSVHGGIITVRNSSCGKVMFSTSVCQEFCPRGVHPYFSSRNHPPFPPARTPQADIPPPGETLPSGHIPLGRHPPPQTDRHLPPGQSLQRTVRILLECILAVFSLRFWCHSPIWASNLKINLPRQISLYKTIKAIKAMKRYYLLSILIMF